MMLMLLMMLPMVLFPCNCSGTLKQKERLRVGMLDARHEECEVFWSGRIQ